MGEFIDLTNGNGTDTTRDGSWARIFRMHVLRA
jgi:hypothetical protein